MKRIQIEPRKPQRRKKLKAEAKTHHIGMTMRMKDVLHHVPFSERTLYRKIRDGLFPEPFYISVSIPVWWAKEIEEWLRQRDTREATDVA